jgi:outer membrane biosynthesis protein TonB
MLDIQIHRSCASIVTMVAFSFLPALSTATELHQLVVVGLPADNVATKHPTPAYPGMARQFNIEGDVLIRAKVTNGNIFEVTAASHSPLLAPASARWVRNRWRFRPSVGGEFTIPISYKLRA